MASANNSLRASIPSLAAVEHRRRELLAWQAAQWAPSAEPPEDPTAGSERVARIHHSMVISA